MGTAIALAILLAVSLELGDAAGEGGPSTFGYDASSACNKPSRVGRSRLENLPCDFNRENWCTIAGNAYPWHAVRRFVHDNQGLLRRMYGDEKHFSVLKTELEKNDIELQLDGDHDHLYTEDARHFDPDYDYDQQRPSDDPPRSQDYRGRSLNTGTSSKLDKPKPGEDALPRHPNETPTASTTSYPSSPPSTTTTTSTTPSTTTSESTTSSSTSTAKTRTKITPVTSTTSSEEALTTSTTTTAQVATLAQIVKIQNLSINEIAGQIDRLDVDVDELTEIPVAETTLLDLEDESSEKADELLGEELLDKEVSESQQQQQFRPRPEYRPAEAPSAATEGQLFQDVAAKQEAPVLKVRGINACPVKEEVVAPFWANNTRGEVLALLNLYPFEQYVHWEKCTHENKQMYCRDGCRCEQQYRLHRLLAYDPSNECRGIFSDWFKFPSCCICRCYDLPLEFRVTSRSPRQLHQRQRLKVRAPRTPPPPSWRHN